MRFALLLAGVTLAGPLHALQLTECARTTHVSHGGEAEHVDLGAGRVMWRDWWSQEGSALTLVVMDCGAGTALRARGFSASSASEGYRGFPTARIFGLRWASVTGTPGGNRSPRSISRMKRLTILSSRE